MTEDKQNIPIFPLGVVLFPGVRLPLHIFEERYKLMVRECREQGSEFGVVYYTGENFYEVGCAATIVKELRRFEDGRSDILIRGTSRFRIVSLAKDKPYLTAAVEAFDDDEDESEETAERLQTTVTLYEELLQLAADNPEVKADRAKGAKEASFFMSSYAGFAPDEKQRLLEMTSTNDRLAKIEVAIKKLFKRLTVIEDRKKIVGGNGNFPTN